MPPITKEMIEERAAQVRLGGKGTMRRPAKIISKSESTEDKKVTNTLKRLGVQPVGDAEEAVFYKSDGQAMIFKNPKLQASMHGGVFVVQGGYETKDLKNDPSFMMSQIQSMLAANPALAQAAAAQMGAGKQ
jgi:nascent polypeptide-associated complex subunit beta